MTCGVWTATELSRRLISDADWRLIAATMIISALGHAIYFVERRWVRQSCQQKKSVLVTGSVAGIALLAGTATLFLTGWVLPVIAGDAVEQVPSITIAIWGLIAAVATFVCSRTSRDQGYVEFADLASASLFPLSILVIVPALADTAMATWVQYAAVGSLGWLAVSRLTKRLKSKSDLTAATTFLLGDWVSYHFAIVVGALSAFSVLAGVFVDSGVLLDFAGQPSALISFLSAAVATIRLPRSKQQEADGISDAGGIPMFVSSPGVALAVLAGQLAWILWQFGWIPASGMYQAASLIGSGAAVLSMVRYVIKRDEQDFAWLAFAAIVLPLVSITPSGSQMSWVPCLVGLLVAGLLCVVVNCTGNGSSQSGVTTRGVVARILSIAVLTCGGFLFFDRILIAQTSSAAIAGFVVWGAGWLTVWTIAIRLTTATRVQYAKRNARTHQLGVFADTEALLILCLVVFIKLFGLVQWMVRQQRRLGSGSLVVGSNVRDRVWVGDFVCRRAAFIEPANHGGGVGWRCRGARFTRDGALGVWRESSHCGCGRCQRWILDACGVPSSDISEARPPAGFRHYRGIRKAVSAASDEPTLHGGCFAGDHVDTAWQFGRRCSVDWGGFK